MTDNEDNFRENEAGIAWGRDRGRMLRGRGRKFCPWGYVGFEDLTSMVFSTIHSQSVSNISWHVGNVVCRAILVRELILVF